MLPTKNVPSLTSWVCKCASPMGKSNKLENSIFTKPMRKQQPALPASSFMVHFASRLPSMLVYWNPYPLDFVLPTVRQKVMADEVETRNPWNFLNVWIKHVHESKFQWNNCLFLQICLLKKRISPQRLFPFLSGPAFNLSAACFSSSTPWLGPKCSRPKQYQCFSHPQGFRI